MENNISIIDEVSLKDKIYIVRGKQVMLDCDLAEIYGYKVKVLNQQVKRNIERFPEDFMFQLNNEEYNILRSKNLTSNRYVDEPNIMRSQIVTSSWGGQRYLPYVFTEQGIYQLTTVLRGDLAIQQSIAIMRAFRALKNYVANYSQIIPQQDIMQLSMRQNLLENDVKDIKENMVRKVDLSDLMKLFNNNLEQEEILIFDGHPFKADIVFNKILSKAKYKIYIIDDYMGIKLFEHLRDIKVDITIFTDNKAKLTQNELNDFLKEYPEINLSFIKTNNKIHDRYIILDYSHKHEQIYHLGASIKDMGKRVTTISKINDIKAYKDLIEELLKNSNLLI